MTDAWGVQPVLGANLRSFHPLGPLDGTFFLQLSPAQLLTPHTRVQKLEIDSFSGYRIYPSKGRLFVRGDNKVCPLLNPMLDILIFMSFNPDLPLRHLQERVALLAAQEPS